VIAPLTIKGKTFQVTRQVTGGDSRDRVYWRATSQQPITLNDAADVQATCGYNSAGYGFFSFTCRTTDKGFQATWHCLASAD